MNAIHFTRHLAAVAAVAFLPFTAVAQDLDPAKMQEVMEQFGNPGNEHEAFASWVGSWQVESTYWLQPGMAPIKSSGSAKFRLLMKGRYLSEQFRTKSEEMGLFTGRGTLAYDRLAKEYIHTWIDSMGTGVMVSRGQAAEDGKSIVLSTTQKDPMTMQDVRFRIVSHLGTPEKRRMEMFVTYPGREEHRLMEITYEKQKEAEGGAVIGAAVGGAIGGAIIGGVIEQPEEKGKEEKGKEEKK